MEDVIIYLLNVIYQGYRQSFNIKGRDSRAFYITLVVFQHLWFVFYLALKVVMNYPLLWILVMIFVLPLLASNIRRLHDSGYSGTWCFSWFCLPHLALIGAMFLPSLNNNNPYTRYPQN